MSDQLLTVSEVAGELSVDDLAVMRLISKRALKGVQVGSGKNRPWRVTRAELLSYVSAGAKDLVMPTSSSAGWFDNRDLMRHVIHNSIEEATQTQRLTDTQILAAAGQGKKFTRTITHRLQVSPSVRRVLQTRIDDSYRFDTVGDDFAAAQLRKAAREKMKPIASLHRLYSGSDELWRIQQEAVLTFLSGKISYHEQRVVGGSTFTIYYELLNSSWMNSDAVFIIMDKAF